MDLHHIFETNNVQNVNYFNGRRVPLPHDALFHVITIPYVPHDTSVLHIKQLQKQSCSTIFREHSFGSAHQFLPLYVRGQDSV